MRRWFSANATVGELHVDGEFFCFTCEDRIRAPGVKVQAKTAIPAGVYRWEINWSPRFARPMPQVLDVPMFTGIRIHAGNTPEDSEGCILVGEGREGETVLQSRSAYARLMARLAGRRGLIHVVNLNPPAELLQ